MDYEFENICKLDESLVIDFFKLWNKQHKLFKKRVLSNYIFLTVMLPFMLNILGIKLAIIIYFTVVVLFYIAFSMGNKKQIKRYLETGLKLYPTGEIHYVFKNEQYIDKDGRKLKYEAIDSVVFSEKLTYFTIGNVVSIFPRDGFELNNYEDFQKFIKDKVEPCKIISINIKRGSVK